MIYWAWNERRTFVSDSFSIILMATMEEFSKQGIANLQNFSKKLIAYELVQSADLEQDVVACASSILADPRIVFFTNPSSILIMMPTLANRAFAALSDAYPHLRSHSELLRLVLDLIEIAQMNRHIVDAKIKSEGRISNARGHVAVEQNESYSSLARRHFLYRSYDYASPCESCGADYENHDLKKHLLSTFGTALGSHPSVVFLVAMTFYKAGMMSQAVELFEMARRQSSALLAPTCSLLHSLAIFWSVKGTDLFNLGASPETTTSPALNEHVPKVLKNAELRVIAMQTNTEHPFDAVPVP